jgi:starch-binding outer membrane protein SusE/F
MKNFNEMKNIIRLFLAVLVMGGLSSCEKKISEITYQAGSAPQLFVTPAAPLVLLASNASNTAVKFYWTNPHYKFSTGISSQDVNYTLEVDTTGANFSSPSMQQLTYARDTTISYNVKDLNSILTKLNLTENIPHNVEFRLKSYLGTNAVPLYSNVIKMVITPYLDVAVPLPPTGELYITGNAVASDWTNTPPASQKFTKVSNTLYTITIALKGSAQIKFLSTQGAWQPQYGGKSSTGGDLLYNMGLPGQSDPDAIPTDAAGTYKITVNFKTGRYTVEKQ